MISFPTVAILAQGLRLRSFSCCGMSFDVDTPITWTERTDGGQAARAKCGWVHLVDPRGKKVILRLTDDSLAVARVGDVERRITPAFSVGDVVELDNNRRGTVVASGTDGVRVRTADGTTTEHELTLRLAEGPRAPKQVEVEVSNFFPNNPVKDTPFPIVETVRQQLEKEGITTEDLIREAKRSYKKHGRGCLAIAYKSPEH